MFQEQIHVEDIEERRAIGTYEAFARSPEWWRRRATRLEARESVDYYYQLQDDRIRAKGRQRAFGEGREPHELITWLGDNTAFLEVQIRKGLDAYASSDFAGKWAMSVCGIGPVIRRTSCPYRYGTLSDRWAYLLIRRDCPRRQEVGEGAEGPFNAKLKVLTWKIK